ncbi:MAG TPA: hypothetical protein DCE33_00360 [Rhodospirillaceae bacterium]|nr:hypothetical protein [Rhodospirillaceae bacterium]
MRKDSLSKSGKRRGFVSVVSPFYNETDIIVTAATRMIESLNRGFADWEFILVDDGSTDDSLDKLKGCISELGNPKIKVLSYQPNMGRCRALKTGIDAASADIIITTEADLSWGEDIVERLHDALADYPDRDFVIASPHLAEGGFNEVPFSRVCLSQGGNRLIGWFFDSGVSMHTGMTRAYRRSVIQPLKITSYDKEFHLEVLLKLRTLGYRVAEIPTVLSWEVRRSKGTIQPKSNLFTRRMMRTISSHLLFLAIGQPMRYFGAVSVITMLTAIGFVFAGLWNFVTGGVAANFILMAGLLALFSVVFLGFSVVFTQLRELSAASWSDGKGSAADHMPVRAWQLEKISK